MLLWGSCLTVAARSVEMQGTLRPLCRRYASFCLNPLNCTPFYCIILSPYWAHQVCEEKAARSVSHSSSQKQSACSTSPVRVAVLVLTHLASVLLCCCCFCLHVPY